MMKRIANAIGGFEEVQEALPCHFLCIRIGAESCPLRIELASAVYQLTSRDNARQNIYEDDTGDLQIKRQIEGSNG